MRESKPSSQFDFNSDIVLYLNKVLGEITLDEEHALHLRKVRIVEDLLFLDVNNELPEFSETRKRKMKIICQYLNLIHSTDTPCDQSINNMHFFVKQHNDQVQINTRPGLTSRRLKKESKEYDEENVGYTSGDNKKRMNKKLLMAEWQKLVISQKIFIIFLSSVLVLWPYLVFRLISRNKTPILSYNENLAASKIAYTIEKPSNRIIEKREVLNTEQKSLVPPSAVVDCTCPDCTNTLLDQNAAHVQISHGRRWKYEFTCRERINYLMGRYQKTEEVACSATAQMYPDCSDKCNPQKCHKIKSNPRSDKKVQSKPQKSLTPPPVVVNCNCLDCTNTLLDQNAAQVQIDHGRRWKYEYTCRKRMNYLMEHYQKTEEDACSATVQSYLGCSDKCNPEKCHKFKSDSKFDKQVQPNPISGTKVQSNPKNARKVQSNPMNDKKVQSNPKNATKVQSNPKNARKVQSNPMNDTKVQSNPKNARRAQSNPKNTRKVQSNARNGKKVQSNPMNDKKETRARALHIAINDIVHI